MSLKLYGFKWIADRRSENSSQVLRDLKRWQLSITPTGYTCEDGEFEFEITGTVGNVLRFARKCGLDLQDLYVVESD